MISNNIELRILVKGKPVSEYYHNGNTYIEGRDGSNFEIEVLNKNGFRIEAILSVDGIAITDGKEAGSNSPGYLVEAYSSVRIPGWKVSDSTAAQFTFSGKKGSYATEVTGSSGNNGVIGAMIYSEKYVQPNMPYVTQGFYSFNAGGSGQLMNKSFRGGLTRSSFSASAASNKSGGAKAEVINRSVDRTIGHLNSLQTCSGEIGQNSALFAPEVVASSQNLGTAFGDATDFATTTVAFTRGDLLRVMVMFYDDLKGLRSRGVPIERISKAKYEAAPQAFPAMNCVPPKNWTGKRKA